MRPGRGRFIPGKTWFVAYHWGEGISTGFPMLLLVFPRSGSLDAQCVKHQGLASESGVLPLARAALI